MTRYIITFLLLLTTLCCEFDYSVDGDFPPFKSQLVLNSTIAPHKPIELLMVYSAEISSEIPPGTPFIVDSVELFDIKIFEDDILVLDSIGRDGVLKTNIYPKPGSTYSLEAEVLNYGKLTAETYIPSTPYKVKVDSIKREEVTSSYHSLLHYEINPVDVSEKTRSLWIHYLSMTWYHPYGQHYPDMPTSHYKNTFGAWKIYVTNPYLDQVNAVYDPIFFNETGSLIVHHAFLRVPFKNLSRVFPINLAFECSNGFDDLTSVQFTIIAPSDDYDKYYYDRSRDIPSSPISATDVNVYSNIKGGLGIFAGYIEQVETITYAEPPQK